ncbi:MAG: hypothetical protein MPEBLZ_01175, partial [Candidatus Methanoperedens nitroreducens]
MDPNAVLGPVDPQLGGPLGVLSLLQCLKYGDRGIVPLRPAKLR